MHRSCFDYSQHWSFDFVQQRHQLDRNLVTFVAKRKKHQVEKRKFIYLIVSKERKCE